MTLRLFVLGATGRTGTHILDLALARNHHVTALVRSPQKITRNDAALTVIQGSPLQAEEMARALPGHDAVISVLGPPGLESFRRSTLLTDCASSTVSAMKSAGVKRIAIMSAAVLFPGGGLRVAFFRWLLTNHARDLNGMESVVRATAFDWTIARPPRLVDAPDETYRSQVDKLPEKSFTMSFRAVAAFLLDSIEAQAHTRDVVGLGRPID